MENRIKTLTEIKETTEKLFKEIFTHDTKMQELIIEIKNNFIQLEEKEVLRYRYRKQLKELIDEKASFEAKAETDGKVKELDHDMSFLKETIKITFLEIKKEVA